MLRQGKDLGPPIHIFFLANHTNIFRFQAAFPGKNTFLSLQIKHSFCIKANILILSHVFIVILAKLECWQTKMCQEKDNHMVKSQSIIMYREQTKRHRIFSCERKECNIYMHVIYTHVCVHTCVCIYVCIHIHTQHI